MIRLNCGPYWDLTFLFVLALICQAYLTWVHLYSKCNCNSAEILPSCVLYIQSLPGDTLIFLIFFIFHLLHQRLKFRRLSPRDMKTSLLYPLSSLVCLVFVFKIGSLGDLEQSNIHFSIVNLLVSLVGLALSSLSSPCSLRPVSRETFVPSFV